MPRMNRARRGLVRVAFAATVVVAWLVALVAGVPGSAAAPAPTDQAGARPAVRLTIVFTRANGIRHVAHLRCSGTHATADGYLRDVGPARACARARRAARLLTTQPEKRACTQIYGGPERARVSGRIGARPVARGFSRTNGCQIADWTQIQPLLPRPSVR
jgi:hypothetical protein